MIYIEFKRLTLEDQKEEGFSQMKPIIEQNNFIDRIIIKSKNNTIEILDNYESSIFLLKNCVVEIESNQIKKSYEVKHGVITVKQKDIISPIREITLLYRIKLNK